MICKQTVGEFGPWRHPPPSSAPGAYLLVSQRLNHFLDAEIQVADIVPLCLHELGDDFYSLGHHTSGSFLILLGQSGRGWGPWLRGHFFCFKEHGGRLVSSMVFSLPLSCFLCWLAHQGPKCPRDFSHCSASPLTTVPCHPGHTKIQVWLMPFYSSENTVSAWSLIRFGEGKGSGFTIRFTGTAFVLYNLKLCSAHGRLRAVGAGRWTFKWRQCS